MGQAFDSRGNVLGEAFGETKREVFDKLMEAHGDAAEIRIRSFYKPGEADPHIGAGASAEMPRYRCHKEVWALKIAQIHADEVDLATGGATITPAETGYAPFKVGATYLGKHKPKTGGYYVVYKDGYASFSPAAAFEEGYARIQEGTSVS